MAYKLIVSVSANENIGNIIEYVVRRLSNPEAAKAILDDIDAAYDRLEEAAEMYPYCNDLYLARKGYRKLPLNKHDYVILYQVVGNEVHIGGIFHTRENYGKKL